MPSPIAHASIALLGTPALGSSPGSQPIWRRIGLWLAVVFACGAPDLDIPIGWIVLGEPFLYHGGPSHSLLVAPVFGLLFVLALRVLLPSCPPVRAWLVGTMLYGTHVLMDTLIVDTRGVSLLWPIVPDRVASPITIFVGVEYSEWWRWDLHLLTILNETAFAVLIWSAVCWAGRARTFLRFGHAPA